MKRTITIASALLLVLAAGEITRGGEAFLPRQTYPVIDGPYGSITGDFNGDGRPDLAVANGNSAKMTVLLADGPRSFAPYTEYSTGRTPYDILCSDFNNDNKLDLVVTNSGTSDLSMFYGRGDGTFDDEQRFGKPVYGTGGPRRITMGYFNDDDRIDLATAFVSGNKIGVYTARGDGGFDGPVTYPSMKDSWNIVAADFNGDNETDLAVLQHYGRSIAVMDGRGDGSFADYVEYPVDYAPLGMVAGDFNGDDRPDLAIGCQGLSQISVYYGQSDGTFGGKRIFQTTASNYDMVASDFNEDGILDLAFNTYNDVQLMYGQGDGSFDDLETYAINGSAVYRLTAADLDLDGHTDLIASSYHTDTINILYNAIPEPATLSMMVMGGLALVRRWKREGRK